MPAAHLRLIRTGRRRIMRTGLPRIMQAVRPRTTRPVRLRIMQAVRPRHLRVALGHRASRRKSQIQQPKPDPRSNVSGAMKTQINSDKQVVVDAELSKTIEADVRRALGTFETRLTRLEVHLSDLNSSSKQSVQDKRCLLEARVARRKPVSVSFEAASVEQAVRGAARKMKRLLDTSFGKSQIFERSAQQSTPRQKSVAAKRSSIPVQELIPVVKTISAGGRSPKKKAIYR